MHKIIDTIRSWFCTHDWELLDEIDVYTTIWHTGYEKVKIGTKWTYRCKKCGYMKVQKNY